MRREPSTTADFDASEAAAEWAEHGDDLERPDLDDRGSSMTITYGPNDHTCVDHPRIGCHVCARAAS